MRNRIVLAASAGLVLSLAGLAGGCGYALVGQGNFLPAEARTIQIPAFVNRTTRVELEQRVTQAVAEEMVFRAKLRIVTGESDADLVLKGSMNSFNLTPVSFNSEGRATEYQVSITAKIELFNRRDENKVIWKNDQYHFLQTYAINLEGADSFDQETHAIREIAQRFAQTLVTTLLEGF
ncbi:MAG TPA: LptE family protein [Thermoanaerobaculia bacterium]|nr:LptE family protein [Thermoanaerobaculia bacterium]